MMEKHFQYWTLLTLFSVVNLTSLTNMFVEESSKDWTREQKWVFSVAAISLIMSVFAAIFHIGWQDRFAGKPVEWVWATIVLIFWCAGMPTLLDTKEQFAVAGMMVDEGLDLPNAIMLGHIANGNLFFSSWGALIVSLILFTSHCETFFERKDDKHLYHWVGFTVSGLVVMCRTGKFWANWCDGSTDTKQCSRTLFGLILGLLSFAVGMALIAVNLELALAQLISVLFLVAWCFAAAYLTYDEGPGVPVGTLYFGVWFALLFSLAVAAPAILEFFHKILPARAATTEETPAAEGEGEVATKDAPTDEKAGAVEVEEEEVAETA